MTKEDWMRDSDFAMARLAAEKTITKGERQEDMRKWWVDFGRDRAGMKFGEEVEGILAELKGDEGMAGKSGRAWKAGM